jgi:hypothetical protein
VYRFNDHIHAPVCLTLADIMAGKDSRLYREVHELIKTVETQTSSKDCFPHHHDFASREIF